MIEKRFILCQTCKLPREVLQAETPVLHNRVVFLYSVISLKCGHMQTMRIKDLLLACLPHDTPIWTERWCDETERYVSSHWLGCMPNNCLEQCHERLSPG